MKLIEKPIIECLPETITTQFDFKGIYVDQEGESHNLTIFDTSYFLMHLYQLQASRKIMVEEDNESTHLVNLFNIWKNSRAALYLKQAYAYTLKYNPIENYSSKEVLEDDITEHEKGASFKDDYNNTDTETLTPFERQTVETTPYEEKIETTPYETKVETTPYEDRVETTPYETTVETTPYTDETKTTTPTNDTTTKSVKGFNSSQWSESEKVERSGSVEEKLEKNGTEKVETTHGNTTEIVETTHNDTKETVETTHNNTKETVEKTYNNTTGKVETYYDGTQETAIAHTGYVEHTTDGKDTDTRNYTLYKTGNIGVMTPAEMLAKEYDELSQDLALRAFNEFIDRFTYYAEGRYF